MKILIFTKCPRWQLNGHVIEQMKAFLRLIFQTSSKESTMSFRIFKY